MFDLSFLPDAQFAFVVVADTHHMLTSKGGDPEFTSRSKQPARAEVAIRLVKQLKADFAVHMGDLVQEYPESEGFGKAVGEAQEVLARYPFRVHQVPGNHDVGDKPDSTMPTLAVTAESLEQYRQWFGTSWDSFDHEGIHCVIVNSQILNSTLPQAIQQRQWLEHDLSRHEGQRIFMFTHLPVYLWDEHEPGLGHYDNIDLPDRRWLLDLVRRYRVEMLFAAHVHWRFFDRIASTRYLVVPSPAFTRPGFSHMFSSNAPPERGRDDKPKMGFLLVRVFGDRVDTHVIRTDGMTALPERIESGKSKFLITCTPANLPSSPLGLVLRGPLTPASEVPAAWPSTISQKVRNDYPLLACLELGARYLKTPSQLLSDALQHRHLIMLREEGVRITARSIWSDDEPIFATMERYASGVDEWELQIPGGRPPTTAMKVMAHVRTKAGLPLGISPIFPNEIVEGKQHKRTRMGYRLDELAELDRISEDDFQIDRILCRIDANQSPWSFFCHARDLPTFKHITEVDVLVELGSQDDQANSIRAAEALLGSTLCPHMRVYFDPLVDMDRTMDVSHGLLDGMCNPRPAFQVLRCLNTILFSGATEPHTMHPSGDPSLLVSTDQNTTFALGVPNSSRLSRRHVIEDLPDWPPQRKLRVYNLVDGTVEKWSHTEAAVALDRELSDQLILLEIAKE